jgi:hypothetical protein
MPLSTLQPLVTARFQEVNSLLSVTAALESTNPLVPDTDDVRALRGLLYVHMYGAFEYAMDQSFIRLAQHVSSRGIARRHIHTPIFSVALDNEFKSLQDVKSPQKTFRKRVEAMVCTRDQVPVTIQDNVLSSGLQSAGSTMIALAFAVYGIPDQYLYDLTAKGYIDEVVERRHAVAHGRESPAIVGIRKVVELRLRYNALYSQSMYVIEIINQFCTSKKYVLPRYRRSYR